MVSFGEMVSFGVTMAIRFRSSVCCFQFAYCNDWGCCISLAWALLRGQMVGGFEQGCVLLARLCLVGLVL